MIILAGAGVQSQDQQAGTVDSTSTLVQGVKIGIVISSNDPETVWNAFRFADFACKKGDKVSVFLLGKGVEAQILKSKQFDVKAMLESFVEHGGKIFACGSCLKTRKMGGTEMCPISTMADMYKIVNESDKLLTF
jgi:uncharacterized protein involved in oxidation of intracellular sulfur